MDLATENLVNLKVVEKLYLLMGEEMDSTMGKMAYLEVEVEVVKMQIDCYLKVVEEMD